MTKKKQTGVEAQAFSLISDKVMARIAQETSVNHFHKKHDVNTVFKLVLFGHLMHTDVSLRVLEACSESQAFFGFSNGTIKPGARIPRSTISDYLNNVSTLFLENLFNEVVEKYRSIIFKRHKNNTVKIDSTYISLSNKLFKFDTKKKWAHDKSVVKATIIHRDLVEQIDYSFEQNYSDEGSFKAAITRYDFKKDDILVFDRGMQNRRSFVEMDEKNISFITRLSSQAKLEIIRELDIPQAKSGKLRIISDSIVRPTNNPRFRFANEFRAIRAENEQGESYVFLSNCLNLTADKICRTYKERWGIEVFFKHLKSYLNGRHFLARSETGIKNTYYLRLIAAILIAAAMHMIKAKSFKIAKIALQNILMQQWVAIKWQRPKLRGPPDEKTLNLNQTLMKRALLI